MNGNMQINVGDKVTDITIRNGSALPLKEPAIINYEGSINAPSSFLLAKKESINKIESTLFVDVNNGAIVFIIDENSYYSKKICGKLVRSKALKDIGVNDLSVSYSDKSLAKFIKQHIFYFTDKEKANELIQKLMKFSAKIQTDIKNDADLKGNVSKAFERVINTGIPDTIDITCKIYDGLPAETFTANICVEADASSLRFYFDSPDLFLLEENLKTDVLNKESKIFEDFGCAIINI